MTERTVPDLVTALRQLAEASRLPIPTRTRLVRELRHDVDGLTDELVAGGMAYAEARARALDMLVPDDATIQELERVGMPWYHRATHHLDAVVVRRLERAALAVGTLALLGLEASALLRAGLLDDPSPFLWVVLGLGAILLGAIAAKAFQLWIKGVHQRPRTGLTAILALSVLTLGVGVAGALVDLTLLAATLEAAPVGAPQLATAWLIQAAALISTAIILAVAGAMGWLTLSSWVTHVEHAHQQALDDGTSSHPPQEHRT